MSKIRQIIEGHVNEFKSTIGKENKEDAKIFQSRARICLNCPLKNGNTCDRSKYINPDTLEVSSTKLPGFVRGCGCRLSAKQKSKTTECPAGFWGGEFN